MDVDDGLKRNVERFEVFKPNRGEFLFHSEIVERKNLRGVTEFFLTKEKFLRFVEISYNACKNADE
jgi:hypothetical protein